MGSRPGNCCSAGHPVRHQFPRGFSAVGRRSVHRKMGDEEPRLVDRGSFYSQERDPLRPSRRIAPREGVPGVLTWDSPFSLVPGVSQSVGSSWRGNRREGATPAQSPIETNISTNSERWGSIRFQNALFSGSPARKR
jgi:hypothetical protein